MASLALARGIGQAEDAADEFEVLANGQVGVERKFLRHVAGAALDFGLLRQDVVAQTGSGSAVRRQQPAEHADGGGLAAAIGTEQFVDAAALHLHRQVFNHHLAAKALAEVVDVDDDVVVHLTGSGAASRAVIGRPSGSVSLLSSSLASTRNTSLPRSCKEKITGGVNSACCEI